MQKLSRREALRGTGVAALAAGAAVIPLALSVKGGELAALIKLYWRQVDEFNNANNADYMTDDESDAHAAATYERTMRLMIGVPARNAEDALAALDWLIKESSWMHLTLNADDEHFDQSNDLDRLTVSLIDAIKDYVRAVA